ncbi:hypothetical protein EMIT0P228_110111 [Pseudomonas brassicacearum]
MNLPDTQQPEQLRRGRCHRGWVFARRVGVYIRCCGNGDLGFRPDGGSLLRSPEAGPVKSKQNAFAPPLGASLRLGMPSLRHCSVGPPRGGLTADLVLGGTAFPLWERACSRRRCHSR